MNWREAGNETFFKQKGSFVEIALFLDVTPCCPVEIIENFKGSCCLALKRLYIVLGDYTASHSSTQQLS
jgi:hypothetical protein